METPTVTVEELECLHWPTYATPVTGVHRRPGTRTPNRAHSGLPVRSFWGQWKTQTGHPFGPPKSPDQGTGVGTRPEDQGRGVRSVKTDPVLGRPHRTSLESPGRTERPLARCPVRGTLGICGRKEISPSTRVPDLSFPNVLQDQTEKSQEGGHSNLAVNSDVHFSSRSPSSHGASVGTSAACVCSATPRCRRGSAGTWSSTTTWSGNSTPSTSVSTPSCRRHTGARPTT